jgi:hypothetical protein
MSVTTLRWKLASPYDAYVSHVSRLEDAMTRIQQLADVAFVYDATPPVAVADAANRTAGFRARLGDAAAQMTDQQFEDFVAALGDPAEAQAARARSASRLTSMRRGLEEYFAIAGHEIGLLDERGYSPARGDVARQLARNGLPRRTIAEYRQALHELGARVGRVAA